MTANAPCVLAIDAGTGSGRAVVFDLEGNQLAVSQQEWTHRSDPRFPASMDFEMGPNWLLLCRCIRKALNDSGRDPSSIKAVSATSMREGIILYDENKTELWGCANVDARAAQEVTDLKTQYPGLEEKIYARTGEAFALGALPRLLWVKRNLPDVYKRIQYISMISDWVLAKLSGEIASDPSNAGTTGIFSLEDRQWAPDIAKSVNLHDHIFPRAAETGVQIGVVTQKAAEETGLLAGTPVVMGGGDVQMGCVGLGCVLPGQMAVLGGTFWQQEVNLDKPLTDPTMKIRVNPAAVPGLWQAEAIAFFCGLVMRWFRDVFCQEEIHIAAKQGMDAYAVLENMARDVPPGSNGILPIFSDAMNFGTWYHAAPSLLNLSIDPVICSKAAIFRALQENAAIATAANLERIQDFTGIDPACIVFGAGASKGPLWCQILADVTGKPVKVPVVKEATALGGAIAAGAGVGLYDDIPAAGQALVRWETEYEPDAGRHEIYRDVKSRWHDAYAAQRALVDAGVTQSMWKAPGL